ncbi:MAG: efflux RND transporter periplasmic adaptor subunit [Planctomycetota bacterium]|jgi:multidrug efflux pump subunit AcrA (membrane-fusion protein)
MAVDIKQLAIDRGGSDRGELTSIGPPRRFVSRYVIPTGLIIGFALVSAWAGRDSLLPRKDVTVIPVHVTTAEVHQSGTALFKAAGWIEPRPTPIRVASLAEGVIETLLVVEDQAVARNEPIAELVDDDARLALEAAQATLKLREAEVERCVAALKAGETNFAEPTQLLADAAEAEAELAKVQTQLTSLPFELASAEAQLRFSKADLATRRKAAIAISEIELAEAESLLDAADARVKELSNRNTSLIAERKALTAKLAAVRRRLELKTEERRTLDEAKAQLAAAAAMQEQADVAVAEAQLRLDRMTIRAPVAGRVMHLLTTPGTFVSGSMSMRGDQAEHDTGTVVTLYQPESLQVRVDVRFEDLPQTAAGQPVQIESPALDEPIVGHVLFPTSFADIQKNTLSVKVALDNPPDVLKPEMLVDVRFLSSGETHQDDESDESTDRVKPLRVLVPRDLVTTDESGASAVWVADIAAGTARLQRIEINDGASGLLIEVTSGLTPASRLIASGQHELRDGDRIRVVEARSPKPPATTRKLERRPGTGR